MNITFADLIAGAVGGLSANSIALAVIWTRLHYIELKINDILTIQHYCDKHIDLLEKLNNLSHVKKDESS